MKKPEVTGKKVAAIAGRVLERLGEFPDATHIWIQVPVAKVNDNNPLGFTLYGVFPVADLKALAASALTQSPDRPKRKAAK